MRPELIGTGRIMRLHEMVDAGIVGAILMEQSDEWAVQRACYMTRETMASLSDKPIVMLSAVPGT